MERPFALIFETLADILKPDHLVKTYLQLVNHEDHNVRISCISLVINMHHLLRERGYPLFCDMLMTGPIQTLASDSVAEVREALLEQISFVGQHLEELEPSLAKEELVPILKELASDESPQTRLNLCSKLSKFSSVLGETEILPLYVKLLKDSEPNVREKTIRNLKDLLKEFNGKAFIQKLMDEAIPSLLSDQWDQVREALAEQISLIGNHMDPSLVKEKLLPIIEALRTDPSNTVRRRTMESLSVMKYISVQVNIARPHHSHVAMTPYRTPSTFGTPSITELLATTPRRQYPASCPPSSRSISSETNQNPKTPTNPFATSMSHRESGAVPLFPSGGAHPIDNEEDIFLFGSHRRSIFEHQEHDAFDSDSHSSRDFEDDDDDHRHSDGRGGWNEEEEEKRLDVVRADELKWEDLVISERIGIGGFAEVFSGKMAGGDEEEDEFSDEAEQKVAIKKLINQNLTTHNLAEFQSEIDIMRRIKHPNVCRFIGACTISPHMCIVTELLEMSLFDLLHNTRIRLATDIEVKVAEGATKGVAHLHEHNIIHRDLKSANILLDRHYEPRITDFGLSRMKDQSTLTAGTGTFQWMAPEVIQGRKYDERSDIYSLAIIFWEIKTGLIPFASYRLNGIQASVAVVTQKKG